MDPATRCQHFAARIREHADGEPHHDGNELRKAIEEKTGAINAALDALNDLVAQATQAGLVVSPRLNDVLGKPGQKSVTVSIAERVEVPQQPR